MRTAGLVAAAVLAATLVAPAPPTGAAQPGDFRITAHRGSPTGGVTENTLPAMRRAIRLKASALEIDVRMTKDGAFVLMHDPTLQRTTTCRGRVDERSRRYVRRHCRGERGREWVPSLGAVLRLAHRTDVNVLMELKGERWSRADVARLGGVVAQTGMGHRVSAMSFHPTPLRRIEASRPGIDTLLLVRRWQQVACALGYADGVNVCTVQLTRARVAAVRRAGKRVVAKMANGRSSWRRLKRYDVGDMITDRVTGYRRWLRR